MSSRPPPRQRLVGQAFGAAWAISRHSPEPVAEKLLESAADRVWKQAGPGVTQLEANLRRAVPGISPTDLRALSHRGMRSYFRYWHEAFRLPSWSHARIVQTVVTSNEAALREVHAAGRGAIVALPHMGNWDLAGAWAGLTGLPVSTIAERLRPESLYDRFVSYRAEIGIDVVPLSGAGNPLTAMRTALAQGRVVCLLGDRVVSAGSDGGVGDQGRSQNGGAAGQGGGVEVVLLDEPARLPGGPAVLSRLSGVPLIVAVPSYRGPLLHLEISDPIAPVRGRDGVVQMTQAAADLFSVGIRRNPEDWHMLHRVFLSDLAEREVTAEPA